MDLLKATAAPTACPSGDYAETYFLVFSNLFMLLPIIYCLRKSPKTYCLELVNMTIVMINSMFYHFCDQNDCTRYCAYPWRMAYVIDFTFSYNLIPTILFYIIDMKLSWIKFAMHGLVLASNFIFVLSYKEKYGENEYFAIVTFIVVLLVLYRFYYLWKRGQLYHEFTEHFDWCDGILAGSFAVIGIGFKMADSTNYWLYHSLWHTFIMISIYFTLEIYDMEKSCLCFKRKTYCTSCAYHAIHGRYPNQETGTENLTVAV